MSVMQSLPEGSRIPRKSADLAIISVYRSNIGYSDDIAAMPRVIIVALHVNLDKMPELRRETFTA